MIKLNDKDILLASMLGNKVMEQLPRFELVQNEIAKRPLPRINVFPLRQNELTLQSAIDNPQSAIKNWQHSNLSFSFLPLTLTASDTKFTFNPEPLISLKMSNEIVKRSPAKAKDFIGTIKEYWSQSDYEILITGFLFGINERGDFQESYPIDQVKSLVKLAQSKDGVGVQNEFLNALDITRLVIEDIDFPFTVGENVQAFEMTCLSDFTETILLELP
jgi:hypothetical protein